jgi:hypothetical protein
MEPTQEERVLAMLKMNPVGITAMEALDVVGCFRLAARINDLKRAGYWIDSEMIEVPTRNKPARVARYRLIGEPQKGGEK